MLDALHSAIESFDAFAVRAALRPGVFVFTPTADGVLTSADAVVKDVERWSRAMVRRKANGVSGKAELIRRAADLGIS